MSHYPYHISCIYPFIFTIFQTHNFKVWHCCPLDFMFGFKPRLPHFSHLVWIRRKLLAIVGAMSAKLWHSSIHARKKRTLCESLERLRICFGLVLTAESHIQIMINIIKEISMTKDQPQHNTINTLKY